MSPNGISRNFLESAHYLSSHVVSKHSEKSAVQKKYVLMIAKGKLVSDKEKL